MNLIRALVYLFCFAAGVGFQTPYFNLYGNFSLIDLLIVVLIPLYLLRGGLISISRAGQKIVIIVFLLALWQIISLLFSFHGVELINFGPNIRLLYYGIILMLFFGAIRKEVHLSRMAQFFILGMFINLINSIYLWNLQPSYWIGGIPILNNDYLSRNVLYYSAVFSIPLVICLAQCASILKLRYFYYLIAGILTAVSFLTYSKGAWVGIIIIWALFVVMYLRRAVIPIVLILIFLSLPFVFGFLDMENIVAGVKHRIFASGPSVIQRYVYLKTATEMGMDNFLLGVGLRNFEKAALDYNPVVQSTDPHNVYAMIFAEAGAIGLFLYFAILLLVIHYLWKILKLVYQRKKDYPLKIYWKTAFMLFIIILFLNLVTGTAFTDKIFPFFLIYVIGLYNIARAKEKFYEN